MGNGTISENDLMAKLVQAKKVMNKVDGGNFERGHINESMLLSDPEELMQTTTTPNIPTRPVGTPSVDKINNSKLPDAIKKVMIENPIPQISLNDTLDMNFIDGARKLMERECLIPLCEQHVCLQAILTATDLHCIFFSNIIVYLCC